MKQGIYILVSKTEIVKAEMGRPEFSAWEMISPAVNKVSIINGFVEHCLSLPRIPIHGKHNWKVWQEVKEGKDFRFGLSDYTAFNLDTGREEGRPTVAFPIEQTKSEQGEKPKCNGNCGMSYCDEYGCIENKPKGDVSHLLTPLEELKLDSNTIRLIERLKELQPYHINPYNLGDEGEVSAIIDKLANLLTNDNPQTPDQ